MSFRTRVLASIILVLAGYVPVLVEFFYSPLLPPPDDRADDFCLLDNSVGKSGISFEIMPFVALLENSRSEEDYSVNSPLILGLSSQKYPSFGGEENNSPPTIKQQISVKYEPQIIAGGAFAGSRLVKSVIQSSFYMDARRCGVPAAVVDGVILNLSQKIDFRRCLKKGDRFEILYGPRNELLYAKISGKHQNCSVYRFDHGGKSAYYYGDGVRVVVAKGNSFGTPLMRALRISSHFGYRRHPINGRWTNHSGVDFVASYGTPVHAIFDGVVTRASYYHGYGHCVDIRHHSGYTSRYAHLSGYNIRRGMPVKKGQMIGRVGSSGTSTGCHLHLELAKNNRTMDPLRMKMIPNESSVVSSMRLFNVRKNQIDLLVTKSQTPPSL
ncbi:MAG: M23 family metallopeptidase [Holosporaceae bacterium]|nr:M23 family metallopeptidase [Holosporaceae bacterium]